MAIVFSSPKKKQKAIRNVIMLLLVLVLFIIPFLIFSSRKYHKNYIGEGGSTTDIKINFDIIDSERVKNLENFPIGQIEFNYVGKDKKGKKVQGTIEAVNKYDANVMLDKMGFIISNLEEVSIGRDEPFSPYYQLEDQTILK